MGYSSEFSRAISIALFIHMKMEEFRLEFVPTKVIAEYLVIPVPTVVKILKSLNAAGITTTKEGPKGGILLSKPAAEITLLDIFLAVEHGPMFKTQLDFAVSNSRIDHAKEAITGYLQGIEGTMKDTLEKTTLADMLVQI